MGRPRGKRQIIATITGGSSNIVNTNTTSKTKTGTNVKVAPTVTSTRTMCTNDNNPNHDSSNTTTTTTTATTTLSLTIDSSNTSGSSKINDQELQIYNEQIRNMTAIEFLQQQQQQARIQLVQNSNHTSKNENDSQTNNNNKKKKKMDDTDDNNDKTNIGMKLSRKMLLGLQQMQIQCCTCPLCHSIYSQPITLVTCTHTFCKLCINHHIDHSWYCPISTCKLPVSMKQRDRKFWNVNAVTQTVVTSWANMCHTLMEADENWWKQPIQKDVETKNTNRTPQLPQSYSLSNKGIELEHETNRIMTKSYHDVTPAAAAAAATIAVPSTKKDRPPRSVEPPVSLGQLESTTMEDDNDDDNDNEEHFATPLADTEDYGDYDDDNNSNNGHNPSMMICNDNDNDSVSLF